MDGARVLHVRAVAGEVHKGALRPLHPDGLAHKPEDGSARWGELKVWAETEAVGCGMTSCHSIQNWRPGRNRHVLFLVCKYGPA